jgi:hypothetical protein
MRSSKKYLASSITVATLLAAAASAQAQTVKTIGQTYNVGNVREWLTKDTDLGKMGAEFYATDDISSTTANAMSQRIATGASVWLFDNKYSLVDFSLVGNSDNTAQITTKLLGLVVSADSYGQLSASVGKCTTEKAPEEQLMIGPVPVVLELSAGLCPGFTLTGSVSPVTNGTSFAITGTPDIGVGATAYVGIGTEVASAGVKGSLTLVDVSVPITNTMVLAGGTLTDTTTGTVDISFLNGELDFYAKAGWGPFSAEYDYTLLSWPGYGWSFVGFADCDPTAKNLVLDIHAGNPTAVAVATYTYAGVQEYGSHYWLRRADDSKGTNSHEFADGFVSNDTVSYTLTQQDSNKYLSFCIIPAAGTKTGKEVCSAWYPVGPLLSLYQDDNYGGRSVLFPYKLAGNGQCVNLTDYGFNDALSSYRFAYDASMSQANLALYYDIGCGGAKVGEGVSNNSASGSIDRSSVTGTFGSSWNDQVTSFRVVWNDNVTTKDLAVTFPGTTAGVSYSYFDANGMPESGTTFQWQRADDINGTNATTVQGYGGTSSYTFNGSEEGKFLRVCAKASNGVVVGQEVCSDWTSVGRFLTLYKDGNYSGTTLRFPYEKWTSGKCVSLGQFGFNDQLTSYKVSYGSYVRPANDSATYGVTFYWDTACGGATTTSTFGAAGGTNSVSSMGSTWNDQASSFRVVYRRVEAQSPAVTWSGPLALPSYLFVDSLGLAESGTTYQWQRADDGAGTNMVTVQPYSTKKAYAITHAEDLKHLRVCIKPSDGVMTGSEVCSDWGSVGMLVTLYNQTNFGGSQLSFAYQHMNSTCFKLSDYGYTGGVVSADYEWGQYNQPAGDTTDYGTTLFDTDDCTLLENDGSKVLSMMPGNGGSMQKSGIGSGTKFSAPDVKSVRINYPHFINKPW